MNIEMKKHTFKIETWVLYGKNPNFCWWDVERRQTRRDFDKRVGTKGILIEGFLAANKKSVFGRVKVFGCLNEWLPIRGSSPVV